MQCAAPTPILARATRTFSFRSIRPDRPIAAPGSQFVRSVDSGSEYWSFLGPASALRSMQRRPVASEPELRRRLVIRDVGGVAELRKSIVQVSPSARSPDGLAAPRPLTWIRSPHNSGHAGTPRRTISRSPKRRYPQRCKGQLPTLLDAQRPAISPRAQPDHAIQLNQLTSEVDSGLRALGGGWAIQTELVVATERLYLSSGLRGSNVPYTPRIPLPHIHRATLARPLRTITIPVPVPDPPPALA